ncbi:MAG TPA: potassium-transporting ATPase subunit F [Hypericibacter adhaerens]|nr:potassium-transporting ATPase subunit F [Hypericibacter adhaerens]HWA44012.1 potassium-transporting ATPase subunit F [Hypericibacter adhaerens]
MSLDTWLGLLFAAIVLIYGLIALIRPERF